MTEKNILVYKVFLPFFLDFGLFFMLKLKTHEKGHTTPPIPPFKNGGLVSQVLLFKKFGRKFNPPPKQTIQLSPPHPRHPLTKFSPGLFVVLQ